MSHATLVPITEARLDALVDLGEELTNLSCYKAPFDRTWTKGVARGGMNTPHFFCRMAQLEDGSYCGFIVGSVTQMLFSPQVMAVEETIYVRDKTPFRASIAKQLLSALATWAFDEKHASFLRAGETSDICPAAVDFFLRSQGFKRAGTLYIKEHV